MDTTPEYVKMCEKATEIWIPHHMEIGDYFLALEENRTVGICTERIDNFVYSPNLKHGNEDNNCIWLPRQDQLQEMVTYHKCPTCHIERTYQYANACLNAWEDADMGQTGWGGPITMEQLWLAFVMKEKFNKTWTGEEWE